MKTSELLNGIKEITKVLTSVNADLNTMFDERTFDEWDELCSANEWISAFDDFEVVNGYATLTAELLEWIDTYYDTYKRFGIESIIQ